MRTSRTVLASRVYTTTGNRERYNAILEIDVYGEQAPYFSATMDTLRSEHIVACGCQHEAMVNLFPKVKKYLKWHLCAIGEGPMHYKANAMYHAGYTNYASQKESCWNDRNREHFNSVIVFGSAGNWDMSVDIVNLIGRIFDSRIAPFDEDRDRLAAWLDSRKPAMMNAFYTGMQELFGQDFKPEQAQEGTNN